MLHKREIFEKGHDRVEVERQFYSKLIGSGFVSWITPPEVLYREKTGWRMYARFEYERVGKKELESA